MSWWRRNREKHKRTGRPAARAAASTDAGGTPDGLLDSGTLGRIGGFDLIAQTVVDGVMSGKHRSTHRGGCCEFSEHRPYTQGDPKRLIDWRLLARRDRFYIKQYDDETNLHAWLVVDASASMAFGMSTESKFQYACKACACLGRLLLRQRDSIGLSTRVQGAAVRLPPRPQASQFQAICQALVSATPEGDLPITTLLSDLPPVLKRRGMVVVFSDCFGDIDRLVSELKLLRLRGHDVMVFQVLAPEERDFNFRSASVFEDLERKAPRLRVEPGQVRQRYLERFEKFQQRLNAELVRAGCDLCTLTTSDDLGDALTHFLSYRAARKRSAARSSA